MSNIDFSQTPHRRYNPLLDEWVLVSPHRNNRPWQGQTEEHDAAVKPKHDAGCYLCAGNKRVNGATNPDYVGPYVFDNDFPALLGDTPLLSDIDDPLFKQQSASGTARVICFSERHDLTLPELSRKDIRTVINLWIAQTLELGRDHKWVAIFENKGAVMGCSNPHPHGQIWASNFVPTEVAREDVMQKKFFDENGTNLLVNYAEREAAAGERIVVENEEWIALVPYWAVWPFETMIIPKRHVTRITGLDETQSAGLADVIKRLCTKYDNIFCSEFPYSFGWHGAPFAEAEADHWQLHAHFYPPLLRSATVRKFMVGYEMLAEAQRDLTPETAAQQLRAQSDIHYKQGTG